MLGLGALAFAQPWLLTALLGLPALWWLLRLVPPPPREVAFPPIRFLLQLMRRETTARRTPWWLLLLRLLAVACLILGAARPLLFPAERVGDSGPLLVVVDDGWAAAPHWPAMVETAAAELERASRDGREAILLTTAPGVDGVTPLRLAAGAAAERVRAHRPSPWWPDRAAAAAAVRDLGLRDASVLWVTDGLATDGERRRAAGELAATLRPLGPFRILGPEPSRLAPLLVASPDPAGGLAVAVRRATPLAGPPDTVRALGDPGEVLARQPTTATDAGDGLVRFDLPSAIAERLRRFEREPATSAGDVVLTDQGLGARRVGVVAMGGAREVQPLLAERFFVERALAGRAQVVVGPVDALLEASVATMILLDGEELSGVQEQQLRTWVDAGGVLLRFAGPRLAERGDDALVPVPLRSGGRLLDGSLSWSEPLALGRFAPTGPLAGLPIAADVRVRRQVLAVPSPELAEATLAELADGTPLVTGRQLGEGWLLLTHTTANTQWADLALSGTFVALLERAADLGRGRIAPTEGLLQATAVLDAFGRLVEPDAGVRPVPAAELLAGGVGPSRPPGLYTDPTTGARRALNLAEAEDRPAALGLRELGTAPAPLGTGGERELGPWLWVLALLLLLVDLVVVGVLRGHLPAVRRPARGAAAAALLAVSVPGAAAAVDAVALTQGTALAYVASGDAELDRIAAAGLEGLARTLYRRTSIEPSDPVAVDLATDPLELFPIVFWPVPEVVRPLTPDVAERLVAYLESGGMVVFDTRDAYLAMPGGGGTTPGMARLRTLLEAVDVPPLERVAGEHALTKSFYLLQDFPGRFTGQPVWVDRAEPGVNDGVSSVVIGANDWLGAWAVDEFDRPLLPVVPGGERQREWARRVGVNLVMYALTGNYKTDQVHVPTLLERLGQ